MKYSGRMQRRILHTSDVHLEVLGDKACQDLKTVVDLAIETKVDLVVVAGDLFDHNRVDDDIVSFVVGQFKRLSVPVVILPGNHDCLSPDSVFERAEFLENCPNIRVFREALGETIDLPDLGISLWGKPIDSYDYDVLPLEGIPSPQRNGLWHIAVAHGCFVGDGPPLFPSYHITQKEIIASDWDYVALGHFVTFELVCDEPVKAFYSGAPSASGTVAIVELAEETGVEVYPLFL
ncbi:exonuclease SbcCD subunit D [Chloroflexota bacterium]